MSGQIDGDPRGSPRPSPNDRGPTVTESKSDSPGPPQDAGLTNLTAEQIDNLVLYEKVDSHIAVITLNRPERRNAMLAPDSFLELRRKVERAEDDDDIKVIVLTEMCIRDRSPLLELRDGEAARDRREDAMLDLAVVGVHVEHPIQPGYAQCARLRGGVDVYKRQGLRPSASRPQAGIVTCATRGLNQRGEQVLDFERTFMVWRSDADAIHYFPEPTTPIGSHRSATACLLYTSRCV